MIFFISLLILYLGEVNKQECNYEYINTQCVQRRLNLLFMWKIKSVTYSFYLFI